jgi:hypothetical protein
MSTCMNHKHILSLIVANENLIRKSIQGLACSSFRLVAIMK